MPTVILVLLLAAQELLSATNGVKALRVWEYLNIGTTLFLMLFAFIVTTEVCKILNG